MKQSENAEVIDRKQNGSNAGLKKKKKKKIRTENRKSISQSNDSHYPLGSGRFDVDVGYL